MPIYPDETGLVTFENAVLVTRREKFTCASKTRINFVCDCTKEDHKYEKEKNPITVDPGEMCVYKYFTRYIKRLSGYGSKLEKFVTIKSSAGDPKRTVNNNLLRAFSVCSADIKIGFEFLRGASSIETENPTFSVSTMKSHLLCK